MCVSRCPRCIEFSVSSLSSSSVTGRSINELEIGTTNFGMLEFVTLTVRAASWKSSTSCSVSPLDVEVLGVDLGFSEDPSGGN